ncbi:MAG: multidrug transporter [Clostridiaceae bacterium]|nr:multidrug transporter [Clostridiaceae bacterium]
MIEEKYTKQDWKLFRARLPEWQSAYMDRLNQEYIEILTADMESSKKFWQLEKRINVDRRKTGVEAEMKRSKFISNLYSLIKEEAISVDDLEGFSDELQDHIKQMVNWTPGNDLK